jgi:excisionase family DNA binding protein
MSDPTIVLLLERMLVELQGLNSALACKQMPGVANEDTEETLWDVREVARFLRCSSSKVYALAGDGRLPALRPIPGGQVRFDPAMVRAWARGEVAL